jgi:hypothetical protein
MKAPQHRTLIGTLQNEADAIRRELLKELEAEVNLTPAETEAIVWTGEVRVFGQTLWHLFKTPGSWDGVTWYRLNIFQDRGLKSREPDTEPEPPVRAPFPPSQDDGLGDHGHPGLDLQG